MRIDIYQGSTVPPTTANVTIVIDVIRAFTVSYHAFLQGASRIYLAESVEQALMVRRENPEYLLAGEVEGLEIEGFDLDNSPYHIHRTNLNGRTLVQKTTNGVRAALNCLSSEHVFVTGFTNARETAMYIRDNYKNDVVNIIASHPIGDDDLACAVYIKSILEESNSISVDEVVERIKHSHVAEKFFDEHNAAFIREDVLTCIKELNSDFVMKINKTSRIPMIERVYI